jgi:hypothetical protein
MTPPLPRPVFIYLLFTFSSTVTLTAFFRAVGASFDNFQDASKGALLLLLAEAAPS